jgi:ABC-type bacteriocin/lantibiotic exporter with double-glycine peptidase domain
MKELVKIYHILNAKEKTDSIKIFVIVAFMAVLDALGVASIMPFLAILGNPGLIDDDPYLSTVYDVVVGYGIKDLDDFLMLLAFVVFILILVAGVYRTYAIYSLNVFIENLRASIGARVFHDYLNREYAFFIDTNTSDLAKSVLSEVDNLTGAVFRPVYLMLANICSCIAIVALLFVINPMLLVMTLGLLGGLYFCIYIGLRYKLNRLGQERLAANKARFFWVNEAFSSIKLLKLMQLENSFSLKFRDPAEQFARSVSTFATYNQIPKYLIEILAFGGLLLTIIFLMHKNGGLANGDVKDVLPTLGLYAFATYRLQPALQAVFSGVVSLRYGAAAIEKLNNGISNRKPLTQNADQHNMALSKGDKLSARNVTYFYPNASSPILTEINLDIDIGSRTAIVGQTGSGKTTLIDILLGLLEPTYGEVVLTKKNLATYKLTNLNRLMGYVPQEVILTDASIRENIAFGVPVNLIDQERVEYCAEVAQLRKFIELQLPDNYQTQIGERGVKLSGGQRQRIGIARALYHGPEIVVFDEATSALDFQTENSVMNAINSSPINTTFIFITHRLNTVRNCDNIYIIESGKLRKLEGSEFAQHTAGFS